MNSFLLVGIGGAIGSIFRYFIQRQWNADFPFGTLTVNVVGCLVIGLFWALVTRNQMNMIWQLTILTGFCGGFTTFSSFTLDSMLLLQQGRYLFFTVYAICNVVLGLIATFAGYKIFSTI